MTSTIHDRIKEFGITLTHEYTSSNPLMENSERMNHYRVRLRCQRRQMSLVFSQGFGITTEPTAADVLNCLASDAAGFENASSFEDWCQEYGMDADSRKAYRTYKAIEQQTIRLHRLLDPLGGAAYTNLLFHTESL